MVNLSFCPDATQREQVRKENVYRKIRNRMILKVNNFEVLHQVGQRVRQSAVQPDPRGRSFVRPHRTELYRLAKREPGGEPSRLRGVPKFVSVLI